jgi:Na+/H+-dicarboxylate symporter
MVIAPTLGNPYPLTTARFITPLLQMSVIGLGAGMNLIEVGRVGMHGFLYTAVGITLALSIGLTFGWLIQPSEILLC